MFGMGAPEMFVILIIALLLFGRRMPEVMRSLGKSVFEFKKGITEGVPEPVATEKLRERV